MAVLVRLACFSIGPKFTPVAPKSAKKGSKKTTTNSSVDLSFHVAAALAALEDPIVAAGLSATDLNLPASVTDAAASRLVSCLADMGHLHLSQLDKPTAPNGDALDSTPASGPTVLDTATGYLAVFISQGRSFCCHGHGVGNTAVDDDDFGVVLKGRSGANSNAETEIVKGTLAVYNELVAEEVNRQKVVHAFKSLLGHGLFHILIGTDLSLQILHTISTEVTLILRPRHDTWTHFIRIAGCSCHAARCCAERGG